MKDAIRVTRIGQSDPAVWEERWRRFPGRTYFQSPAWNQAWADTWPEVYQAVCLEIDFVDGCRLFLPGCLRKRAFGFESTFWSAPGNGPAGFLNPMEEWFPRREAAIKGLRREIGSVLWTQPGQEPASNHSHAVDLTGGGLNEVYRKSRGGQYARQAASKGFVLVEEPAIGMLDELMAIYAGMRAFWTSKGLHHPVYPLSLIRSIARSPGAVLAGVRDPSGRLLLGGFLLEAAPHVASWFTFADPAHRKLRAQEFYFFSTMFRYRDLGYATYDLNPSAGLAGVEQFKEKFGASPRPLDVLESSAWITRSVDLIDRWRSR